MYDATSLHEEFDGERVPPGQRETTRFPVLSKSGTPSVDLSEWTLDVWGAVNERLELDFDALRGLDTETQRQDFHCVTGWSRLDNEFTGVTFPTIVEAAGVTDEAVHVMFHAADGYTTNLPLDTCTRREMLVTWEHDGERLPADHGGPVRVVVPHRYAYKGAKWLTGIEFLTEPERGYWEKRGYSNTANPWNEERYA
ncbi:molybdopterin-dependent oxidoreductase [Halosegnis rubeus]|jgi:DMSO/TMAO reductase YedYZ molybdopterin-dependent catalytic subunit|uniref:Molybdopterin-dependent oxidoreductase n=1 Tax=Halosegnis rubeus TaxID=2212850 RepID=A0A5N5U2B4_9EURY|nr:sulfite oxidase-like oxidoreductase [Halosegnis rubeus]KAB7512680.1 molybdopterin-dependent oxidoreductase [Halosegnis rubeus]KAB7515494.1 molybdopterin-dependent oxidoreductase [Halosegnis rubeus]KAB7518605.1 molybdopterin-dependent oxidoreductase [Halosegnis rubeus]